MTEVQRLSESGVKVGRRVGKCVKGGMDNIQDQADAQSSNSDSESPVDSPLLEGLDPLQGGSTVTGQSLQRYYYSERERYLPLANITRSLKDVAAHAFPGRVVKVSKEGEEFMKSTFAI